MKRIPTSQYATPACDQMLAELRKRAVEWPADLPKPDKFPATLKDFFSLIVKAKTPADCMTRFRQFLREKMQHETDARDAHWDVPRNRFTNAERDTWAVSQIVAINDGDKKVGYFTQEIWLGMASAYKYWWNNEKSIKARESAKKRKPRS